jgi:cell division protein FtsB
MPRRRARRRPSRSTLALRWLAVVCLAVIAAAYVHPVRAYLDARGEAGRQRDQVAELEREQRELEARLAVARTDEFVEREARRLGLVHPGERLFIVNLPGR